MPGILINTGSGAIGISGSPPAPVGLVEAVATGTTTVQVSWTDDAAPEAPSRTFLVERSTDGESWTEIGTPTASPFNDTGRSPGTLYYYRVTARNFWGTATPLSTTVTTESEGAPDAPSSLNATALGSSSIGLTWTDNSDNETNFELQRATEDTFASPTTMEPAANAVSATDSGLTEETEYFYRIRATNGTGDSSWSSTVSATTASEGAAPEFSLTAVPDATVGVTADIADWYTEHGATGWWLWQVRTHDVNGSGHPGLAIISHRDSNGARLYEGDGAFGFTENTAEYGVDWSDLPATTGGWICLDFNHDGNADFAAYAEANNNQSMVYDTGDGSLTIANAPWIFEGLPHLMLDKIEELQPSGYLRLESAQMVDWPTTLSRTRFRYDWNGSAWTENKTSIDPPSGIPPGTILEMESYLYDGVTNPKPTSQRYLEYNYVDFDLTGDGVDDDLIIEVHGSYGGELRSWFLTNNGDGTYTDRTEEWNLPTSGVFIPIRQKEFGRPFSLAVGFYNSHAHIQIGGNTRPDLFLANIPGGGSYGHYRWNEGDGEYELLTGSPLTSVLGLDDSYQKRLYGVDLMNRGVMDLVLSRPRSGYCYVFINNGSGTFTEWTPGRQLRHIDSDGLCIDDLDGDRLPELILLGDGGADSGVTSSATARCLSVWENTTTNPGNAISFLFRRTGHPNYFGVGTRIDVHEAGQSFSAASLIRRSTARPDGLKLDVGVGSASTVDYRIVEPDGTVTEVTGASVNQTVTFTGA